MRIFYLFFLTLFAGFHSFSQTGTIDNTFETGSAFNDAVYKTLLQEDGKIIVVGAFTSYNDTLKKHIVRLNPDGSIDQSFESNGANNDIYDVVIQSDGMILIGGDFTTYSDRSAKKVARLFPDGSLDSTFNVGSGANFTVLSLAVQANNKIVVGGNFSNFNFSQQSILVRLLPDGSLDDTFNAGPNGFNGGFNVGSNNYVSSILIQNDQKILVGGLFNYYNGAAISGLMRLLENGTPDPSFTIGNGLNINGSVLKMILEADQKIVVAGYFSTISGTNRHNFARLFPDGSVDSSINNNLFFGPTAAILHDFCRQADGSYLLAGGFSSYGTVFSNNLFCLSNEGAFCTNFDIGAGTDNVILTCITQTDGKIIIGGYFTSYDGQNHNRIIRLNPYNLSVSEKTSSNFTLFPNPFQNEVYVVWDKNLTAVSYHLKNSNGQILQQGAANLNQSSLFLNLTEHAAGLFFLELFSGKEKKSEVIKVIKY